ncbi:MAG: hypothetical protein M0R03_20725 [Novosphingobium sp.]|jgi:hypothetical protein|nr:hypothetical protein [Novosphingobium sp.]
MSIWTIPKNIIVEPRKVNGELDVKRFGEPLVSRLLKVRNKDELTKIYFEYHKNKEYSSGEDIQNWLKQNNLVIRARYW